MDKTAWKRFLRYAMDIASKACMTVTYIPNLNGGKIMRHFYFRLIFGIVCLAVAVISVMKANMSFAALYVVLGIVFLCSAYSIRKKEKGKR